MMRKANGRPQRIEGWAASVAWALAGALFCVSLLTGFSIGLYLFPFAALATMWLAANAAGREAIAFPVGALLVALLAVLLG